MAALARSLRFVPHAFACPFVPPRRRQLHIAIAGAGVSGSILAAQLAKHAGVRVTLIERFARGALPPGLNLLLNHNGMAALGELDHDLAAAVKRVGEPMVSWSAATLTGRSLYRVRTQGSNSGLARLFHASYPVLTSLSFEPLCGQLGDVTAAGAGFAAGDECAVPLADTYGVRGRWRDLTATCQLAAIGSTAEIFWRAEIAGVRYNGDRAQPAGAPLTLTVRHAAKVAGGEDSYSNQEEHGLRSTDADGAAAAHRAAIEAAAWRDGTVEELDVDLLIGCDGRYSAVRRAVVDAADTDPSYGPPYVSDFRLVVPLTSADASDFFSGEDAKDLRRLYNVPCAAAARATVEAAELEREENASFVTHCAAGLARVGVMTISPSRLDAWGETAATSTTASTVEAAANDGGGESEQLFVGFFGNFRMPEGPNEPIPPLARTEAGLRAMFTPRGGEGACDALGRFVLRTLTDNAELVHWTRMQSTRQRVLPVLPRVQSPRAPGVAAYATTQCGGDQCAPPAAAVAAAAATAATAAATAATAAAGPPPSAVAHYGGRVLLLGDAAGAMYPALGQGANQAIEDACAAVRCHGDRTSETEPH